MVKSKHIAILLFFTACSKKVEPTNNLTITRTVLPSCDEDPLFCDDELDDLPEQDTGE